MQIPGGREENEAEEGRGTDCSLLRLSTDGATAQDAGCLLQRVPGVCFAVAVYRKLLGIKKRVPVETTAGGGGGAK